MARATSSSVPSADKLRILVCTANMGNAEPTVASMKAWIPPLGSCDGIIEKCSTADTFDIIAIGMQESTWKKGKTRSASEEFDTDDDLSIVEKPSSGTDASTTTTTQLQEMLDAHDSTTLRRMLSTQVLDGDYTLLVQKQRGQMRLYVFVRNTLASECTSVQVRCENTGIGHVLANKGGIVASFCVRQTTRLAFGSAHLAAHEGPAYYAARCANVKEILKGCSIGDTVYDPAIANHHFFFCGDLNFRTKFPPPQEGQPELEHEQKVQKALDLVEAKDYETLYAHDELQQGMAAGDVFCGFQTLPCNFSPTFKVERQAGFCYKKQRTPSYADRVVWRCSDGLEHLVTPCAYQACPDFVTSDHKPVRSAFTLVPNAALPSTTVEKTHLLFTNLKGFDLPAMDVDGSSDPYLEFVLSPDIRSTKQIRRGITGNKSAEWTKTKFAAKNLNPVWEKEVDVLIEGEVGADAMLLVTAMDYDMSSKDDIMGTCTFMVQDLIAEIPSTQTVDRPLLKYGRECGRIQFTLQVFGSDGSRPEEKPQQGVMHKARSLLGIKKQQR